MYIKNFKIGFDLNRRTHTHIMVDILEMVRARIFDKNLVTRNIVNHIIKE